MEHLAIPQILQRFLLRIPGSQAAKSLGCCCNEYDNSFGTGAMNPDLHGRRFIVSESCIIHGVSSWMSPKVNDTRVLDLNDQDHMKIIVLERR